MFKERLIHMKMKISAALLWISAIAEAFLAIPLIGGTFVISTGYSALGAMFVLHAVTLFFCFREYSPKSGPILGLVTSMLAWIPLIGWALHLLTAIVLFINAAFASRRSI